MIIHQLHTWFTVNKLTRNTDKSTFTIFRKKRKVISNGDLRGKQSNHKTDESMKIGQSVGLFGQLFLLVMPECQAFYLLSNLSAA